MSNLVLSGGGADLLLRRGIMYIEETPLENLTFTIITSGTINWKCTNNSYSKTIQYNINGTGWKNWTSSSNNSSVFKRTFSAGQIIEFRGTNTTYATSTTYRNYFDIESAQIYISGSIMSLLGDPNLKTISSNYAFAGLFSGRGNILSAPILPATTLTKGCYASMFNNCNFTSPPELPATTLAQDCYNYMFISCSKFTVAPLLPAKTLVSGCYTGMFYNCSSLNYIKALFTTTPSSTYTSSWVSGVSSTGIFIKSSDATWNVTGNNGIPSGWTIQIA